MLFLIYIDSLKQKLHIEEVQAPGARVATLRGGKISVPFIKKVRMHEWMAQLEDPCHHENIEQWNFNGNSSCKFLHVYILSHFVVGNVIIKKDPR